ncbi:MAG: hypothetical protein ACRDQW_12990 [Haloechinothrix sp.]
MVWSSMAEAGEEAFMAIEELDLPSTTELELNVAAAGESEVWQALEDLSPDRRRLPCCSSCCSSLTLRLSRMRPRGQSRSPRGAIRTYNDTDRRPRVPFQDHLREPDDNVRGAGQTSRISRS